MIHFNLHGGFYRKSTSIHNALVFDPNPLSHPLLKMDKAFQHAALVFNHHLWHYTDISLGEKEPEVHLPKMIALLLVASPLLVDEIYCQVIKQMTECSNQ